MLLFKERINYYDPLNVIFLCGSKFTPKSDKDKRIILKDFLLSSDHDCQIVILEENFSFVKNRKGYLAYDDIFITNLSEVEKLAALYANKVIVIHETISTGAEIGMFASNPLLTSKVCVLFPDDISIEEKKMSSFIELAFFNNYDLINPKPTKLEYYPDIEVHRSSINKSEYYTYFHENKIGENLGNKILEFIKNLEPNKSIEIKKSLYGKTSSNKHIINYFVSEKNKKIDVTVNPDALKIQLLSMFAVESFKTELRKEKTISEHVSFIEKKYKEVLLNSVCNVMGIDASLFSINVKLIGIEKCKFRQAIGYFLYMLQAINLIALEQLSDANNKKRKIRIKETMDPYICEFKNYIYEKPETVFGGIMS